MTGRNTLLILSDQHNRAALGCAGHPLVRTPNLDALAARGTRFTAAYTPSPICVPARAALATGLPVHRIGAWDNAHPYDGSVRGWAHALRDAGCGVVSIGKLHFRSEADDVGLERQILPLHVVDGVGDVRGSVREPLPGGKPRSRFAERIGPGESGYTRYDREITTEACRWLLVDAPRRRAPWVLIVSFVAPHHPLIAPPAFFDLYDPARVPVPKASDAPPTHPWVRTVREQRNDQDFFTDETRRIAIASYFGLCSFLDANVGAVLAALSVAGLADTTRVVYASDHGENLGARQLWGKYNLYEEAVGVPLIVAGPDVPVGRTVDTPVSLLDLHPTLLAGAGLPPDPSRPGRDLLALAEGADADRTVLSEYHGIGSPSAAYMVRRGAWKYMHYVGFAPELFDLCSDPDELQDRAADPEIATVLAGLEETLRARLDPDAVDRRAKGDQRSLIERHGGRDRILRRGVFQGTPAPGDEAEFLGAT